MSFLFRGVVRLEPAVIRGPPADPPARQLVLLIEAVFQDGIRKREPVPARPRSHLTDGQAENLDSLFAVRSVRAACFGREIA